MLLTHMKDLAVRPCGPAQSDSGENECPPRSYAAGNCYHPKDTGFHPGVRFVSGTLQNARTGKR
jgi:hypothetical protein